ncbi:MAG: hypothetical protein RIA71_14845 [Oceanicaulis sp.]
MPITDWRLHESGGVLYIQSVDDQTPAGRHVTIVEIVELSVSLGVLALAVEPRTPDAKITAQLDPLHHDALAALIVGAGVRVYVLISHTECADARHHVFALQRAGVLARLSASRDEAVALVRRLLVERPGD